MSFKVSIKGLDKGVVLASLYNNTRPQGMFAPSPMTAEDANKMLEHETRFDYLNGRSMKIRLDKDEIDVRGYDRDNGEGLACRVVEKLRRGIK